MSNAYFFFSYSRANMDAYLEQFFDDLSAKVFGLSGLTKKGDMGFFDKREMQLGAKWDDALVNALQSAPVIVSMYSPAYFNSEACGKEWQVFYERARLYAENNPGAGWPAVIKPVVWIPFDSNLPQSVTEAQYFLGTPEEDHNRVGVLKMRRLISSYERAYDDFLDKLAQQIVAARNYKLPPLADPPDFNAIAAPFPAAATPASTQPPPARTRGPKNLRFVFVAGAPSEFPQTLRREIKYYQDSGGWEWKPFLDSESSPIGVFVQEVTSGGDLKLYKGEMAFSENLPKDIRDAEESNSLVILLVDTWTATKVARYRRVLEEIDKYNYGNCSIIIPWSDEDSQMKREKKGLESELRQVFKNTWKLRDLLNPIYFVDYIRSAKELREKLPGIIRQLYSEVVTARMNNPQADIYRPVDSDIEKPII